MLQGTRAPPHAVTDGAATSATTTSSAASAAVAVAPRRSAFVRRAPALPAPAMIDTSAAAGRDDVAAPPAAPQLQLQLAGPVERDGTGVDERSEGRSRRGTDDLCDEHTGADVADDGALLDDAAAMMLASSLSYAAGGVGTAVDGGLAAAPPTHTRNVVAGEQGPYFTVHPRRPPQHQQQLQHLQPNEGISEAAHDDTCTAAAATIAAAVGVPAWAPAFDAAWSVRDCRVAHPAAPSTPPTPAPTLTTVITPARRRCSRVGPLDPALQRRPRPRSQRASSRP